MAKLKAKTPPVSIEEGLLKALEQHIEERHSHEISQHNAGLAVNLVEQAMGTRAQRIHKLLEKGEVSCDVNALPVLMEDFGIGVKPGDE